MGLMADLAKVDEEFEEMRKKAQEQAQEAEPVQEAADEDAQAGTEQEQEQEQEPAATETQAEDADDGADKEPKKGAPDPEMARRRVEIERMADKKAQEIAEKLLAERQRQQQAEPPNDNSEPDKALNPEAWAQWRATQLVEEQLAPYKPTLQEIQQERQYQEAERHFTQLEGDFLAETGVSRQEYQDVIVKMANVTMQGLLVQNPTLTRQQAQDMTKRQLLHAASTFFRAGHNPAQALYERGKALGFAPSAPYPEPQEVQEPKQKASIKNLLKNKKPASSPLAAGGKTGSMPLTKDALDRMTITQLSKLTPEQLAEVGLPVQV